MRAGILKAKSKRKHSSSRRLWKTVFSSPKRGQYLRQNIRYVEVFLLSPVIEGLDKTGQIQRLFTHKVTLHHHDIYERQVFFTNKQAQRMLQFCTNDCLLLRAYIPETMIQGQVDKTVLKAGTINSSHIHGCFCSWLAPDMYFVNPQFNVLVLTHTV